MDHHADQLNSTKHRSLFNLLVFDNFLSLICRVALQRNRKVSALPPAWNSFMYNLFSFCTARQHHCNDVNFRHPVHHLLAWFCSI